MIESQLHWREETVPEFAARMGIHANTFSRKVRQPDCPQNFQTVEGPSGRIMKLRASRELENFMRDRRKAKEPSHA